MEVILLERIEKLGQMGDVVKDKDGFARNFLLPQKKALRASEDNLAYFEKEKVTLEANNLKQKQEAEVILTKLDDFNLIIIRQAGETGQLYGSVNTNDVKTSLNENGFVVEKNQIKLDKPIKELGIHKVSVKLHPEVQAIISVIVSRTESEAETLIKGDEIKIESEENLISEDTINLEEVFEEGAVPEDINEIAIVGALQKENRNRRRIGYGAGDRNFIKSIAKLQSQSTTNPCSISQMAAKHALEKDKDFLGKWIKEFESRKVYLLNFFQSIKGLKPFHPHGAFYLYISCEGFINQKDKNNQVILNDLDFAEYLLNNAKVAVVPGAAFGKSPYFRLSYATSFEKLKEACERITSALKNFDIK